MCDHKPIGIVCGFDNLWGRRHSWCPELHVAVMDSIRAAPDVRRRVGGINMRTHALQVRLTASFIIAVEDRHTSPATGSGRSALPRPWAERSACQRACARWL